MVDVTTESIHHPISVTVRTYERVGVLSSNEEAMPWQLCGVGDVRDGLEQASC